MSIRYVRVKHKTTGHEFDVLEEQYDSKTHNRLEEGTHSRPRRAKPYRSLSGADGPTRAFSARMARSSLEEAAEAAGIDHEGVTRKDLAAALNDHASNRDPASADQQ